MCGRFIWIVFLLKILITIFIEFDVRVSWIYRVVGKTYACIKPGIYVVHRF